MPTFSRVFLFLLFLFVSNQSIFGQEAAPKGKIYFVLGSDSSTPGINVRDKTSMYKAGGFDLFTAPDRNAALIMDPAFRSRFVDSDQKPFRFTWWMQGGSLYRYAQNTNVPYPSLMSLYLMNKYQGEAIKSFGDEWTYHYHTWVWSDYNGDGTYFWNQTDSYLDARADYLLTMAEGLVEEDMFPVSFRSGWHYMDNDWQADLNDWTPFSLHNASPANARDTLEPIDNLFVWKDAPAEFVPFKPSSENYQLPGGKGGWNTRSISFSQTTETRIRAIFEAANAGLDQVPCIWSHVADNTFMSDLERVLTLIEQISKEYPEIHFTYDTAVEAMQKWLKTDDKTPPELMISKVQQAEGFKVRVQSDEAIFQKHPLFVAKDRFEQHRIIAMNLIGDKLWETNEVLSTLTAIKWSVAVTDSVGNLTKYHQNELPDDVFLDNESNSYSETAGSNWQTISNNTLDLVWGRTARLIKIAPNDSASALWKTSINQSATYSIYTRIPSGRTITDSSFYEIRRNTSRVRDTILVKPLLDKWIHLGTIDAQEDDTIKVILHKKAYSTEETLLADVIKISPLQKPVWLQSLQAGVSLEQKMLGNSYTTEIKVENSGFETGLITDALFQTNDFTLNSSLPISIAAFSVKPIELGFQGTQFGLVTDTLDLITTDPNHPILRIPLKALVKDYFELVDNDDSTGYEEVGDWRTSSAQSYGLSSRYVFINTTNQSAYVEFETRLKEKAFYNIAFILPAAENSAERARYTLFVNDVFQKQFIINQNSSTSSWRSLGIVELQTNDHVRIKVDLPDVNQSNKVLRSDAIQVEKIGTALQSVVLDNEDQSYSEKGTWSTSVAKAYGESSRFAPWGNSEANYSYLTSKSGVQQLDIIIPKTINSSTQANYSVYANGIFIDEVIVNQNEDSGDWKTIGAWAFNANQTIRLRLTNAEPQNSSNVLRADAIRWTFGTQQSTSTEFEQTGYALKLFENYPNPFNPSTTITYSVPKTQKVSLSIISLLGQTVANLVNEQKQTGEYSLLFDGSRLSSGVYFIRMQTAESIQIQKMLLLK